MTTIITSPTDLIEDAPVEELEARLDQLEDFTTANQSNWGGVDFPIHDPYSGDDPDAAWNSTWRIEAELARR